MTVLLAGVVQHLTPTALCAHWPSKDGGRGLHSAGGFWALVFLNTCTLGGFDLIFQTRHSLNANLLNVVGFPSSVSVVLFLLCCALIMTLLIFFFFFTLSIFV